MVAFGASSSSSSRAEIGVREFLGEAPSREWWRVNKCGRNVCRWGSALRRHEEEEAPSRRRSSIDPYPSDVILEKRAPAPAGVRRRLAPTPDGESEPPSVFLLLPLFFSIIVRPDNYSTRSDVPCASAAWVATSVKFHPREIERFPVREPQLRSLLHRRSVREGLKGPCRGRRMCFNLGELCFISTWSNVDYPAATYLSLISPLSAGGRSRRRVVFLSSVATHIHRDAERTPLRVSWSASFAGNSIYHAIWGRCRESQAAKAVNSAGERNFGPTSFFSTLRRRARPDSPVLKIIAGRWWQTPGRN